MYIRPMLRKWKKKTYFCNKRTCRKIRYAASLRAMPHFRLLVAGFSVPRIGFNNCVWAVCPTFFGGKIENRKGLTPINSLLPPVLPFYSYTTFTFILLPFMLSSLVTDIVTKQILKTMNFSEAGVSKIHVLLWTHKFIYSLFLDLLCPLNGFQSASLVMSEAFFTVFNT